MLVSELEVAGMETREAGSCLARNHPDSLTSYG